MLSQCLLHMVGKKVHQKVLKLAQAFFKVGFKELNSSAGLDRDHGEDFDVITWIDVMS